MMDDDLAFQQHCIQSYKKAGWYVMKINVQLNSKKKMFLHNLVATSNH